MKNTIVKLLSSALEKLMAGLQLPSSDVLIQVEPPRDPHHGDYATNLAFILAKPLKKSPHEIALMLSAHLPASPLITKTSIAGGGFINFVIDHAYYLTVLEDIFASAHGYGRNSTHQNQRIHLEFVSSNPTGPLHVGHGRAAAFGSILANLLQATGYQVTKEYYVNDAGRQMNILAVSVWLRYLQRQGEQFPFPPKVYQGEYIYEIADELSATHGKDFYHPYPVIAEKIKSLTDVGHEEEAYTDSLITVAKDLLGTTHYQLIFDLALKTILKGIHDDLENFGVTFDQWFSEQSLHSEGRIKQAIQKLRDADIVYEHEGALWFKATQFGDEKDRVLLRDNGQPTYFAADVAHYEQIYSQKYDKVINILGADHHGYAPRIKAVLQALKLDTTRFETPIVQFAILYRGDERVQMSTRSGSFVTLAELVNEVGKDCARFFYVSRKMSQHMDFDLEAAKQKSAENPIYYIQYAHARICSVFRQLGEKKLTFELRAGIANFAQLTHEGEIKLFKKLNDYPEIVSQAAESFEPHLLTYYLQELAHLFHNYYNSTTFLVDDKNIRHARLMLISAVKQVLANALAILGLSAPEVM